MASRGGIEEQYLWGLWSSTSRVIEEAQRGHGAVKSRPPAGWILASCQASNTMQHTPTCHRYGGWRRAQYRWYFVSAWPSCLPCLLLHSRCGSPEEAWCSWTLLVQQHPSIDSRFNKVWLTALSSSLTKDLKITSHGRCSSVCRWSARGLFIKATSLSVFSGTYRFSSPKGSTFNWRWRKNSDSGEGEGTEDYEVNWINTTETSPVFQWRSWGKGCSRKPPLLMHRQPPLHNSWQTTPVIHDML